MREIILDVKNISYRYDTRTALRNVSFHLHRGEMMGLVGPNGSGKSTLLKVLLGLLPLQTGEVYWFNQKIKDFKNWVKVGYVSQKANSFNSGFPATVEEVVTMGITGRLGLFRRPDTIDRMQIQTAIDMVGLGDFAGQNIGQLSGGQQQRVFIARALVSDPEVLILDEPTVGVDAKSEEEFYLLLQRLNRVKDLTIILVSHDLSVVSTQMNSIACLNQTLYFHGCSEDFEKHRTDILLKSYGHDVHVIHHEH